MAAQWTKIAADLDSHPKVRKAGRDGREVFLFVLRKNAQHDFNGCVPASHLEPWYLADQLMMDEVTASNGLSRAVTAGLLTLTDDGYLISGWDDEWAKRPLTTAERQERFRQKHKLNKPVEEPVTGGNGDPVTGNASNALDKSREEKIRQEEKREEVPAKGRRKPSFPLPVDWKPGPEHAELAKKRGVDFEVQLAKFKAHAETNDRRAVRWGAAFTQWLLSAWPERKPPATTGASLVDRQLADIARMEREEAEAHDQH